jgi:DNA-binding response OmpR family regulator
MDMPEGKAANKQSILVAIVDDHVDSVTSISNYLEANGFRTAWAYNAQDGIKICKEKKPDLLLIGTRLGETSGFDVVRSFGGKQKAIFTTSHDDVDAKAKEIRGCVGVVRKPVDCEALVIKIREIFNISEKRSD